MGSGVKVRKASLYLANILLIASLLIFAKGFFPHKAFLTGLATWSEDHQPRLAPFNRVVFMVVDALRSDFVYSNASHFAFTQSLIRSGAALPFTGHASAPTITMPRVKAVTTGSVPSFVDLVLNFAESDTTSTLKDQDSWLAQMRAKSGNLVMYGDDTWLRLFPDFFHRADGTTSFFVSDFTEVDNNVTRHISSELRNDDWSAMTLHFLGLDHIGHKTGPKGPNMPAKQVEMDTMVHQIYTAMEDAEHMNSCLLVLLGDHGMNEGGNHGASSPGEVSTALTFISPKFKSAFEGQHSPIHDAIDYKYYDVVEQSDIVPTLAALLGFPIPKNNLGVAIPRLLELWTVESDRYNLLHENAEQIYRIAEATFPNAFAQTSTDCSTTSDDDASILACLWRQVETAHSDPATHTASIPTLKTFLYKAQTLLSGTASNYDLAMMQVGIAITTLALVLCLPSLIPGLLQSGVDGIILGFTMLIYTITMFASSYVEEEHQFWYWIMSAWLVVLFCKDARYSSSSILGGPTGTALAFMFLLVTRRWRQTGQKYAGEPDLLTNLVTPNSWILWVLVILIYAHLARNLSRRVVKWMEARQMSLLPVLVSISTFLFKIAFTAADAPELLTSFPILNPLVVFVSRYPLVSLARIVFLGLAHLLGCAVYYEAPWQGVENLQEFLDAVQDVLSMFLVTQSRTLYIPLYLFFSVQIHLLRRGRQYSVSEISILALLAQYASFFTFGGTNSIATIDLSNAFMSNWAGPVWWAFAVCQLYSAPQLRKGGVGMMMTTMAAFACVHTLAVMVACLVLREHLFIWTVFSPKYLYTGAWVVGQHTVVNMLAVGGLLWHDRS